MLLKAFVLIYFIKTSGNWDRLRRRGAPGVVRTLTYPSVYWYRDKDEGGAEPMIGNECLGM